MKQYLAIDIGGTAVKYALICEDATISEQSKIPAPARDMDEFVSAMGDIYDRFADRIEAVVVSTPGKIDSATGFFYTGGSLRYITNMDVAAYLKKRIHHPICFENDGKAAALAELWKGSMQGICEGIVMTLESGVGGSLYRWKC